MNLNLNIVDFITNKLNDKEERKGVGKYYVGPVGITEYCIAEG